MTHEAKARPIEPSPWSNPASVLMSSNPGGGQESTGYNQVFFPDAEGRNAYGDPLCSTETSFIRSSL
jgi:hypothetical protein